MSDNKRLSPAEAAIKLARYCAYQERSQQQVRNKLYEHGLRPDEVEEVIAKLITQGFINEERFAISYAGGKFRLKQWGRKKIIEGLKLHRISDYCIKKGLEEIDDTQYLDTLKGLIEKKRNSLRKDDPLIINQKIARYVTGKGFEPELVWQILKEN